MSLDESFSGYKSEISGLHQDKADSIADSFGSELESKINKKKESVEKKRERLRETGDERNILEKGYDFGKKALLVGALAAATGYFAADHVPAASYTVQPGDGVGVVAEELSTSQDNVYNLLEEIGREHFHPGEELGRKFSGRTYLK